MTLDVPKTKLISQEVNSFFGTRYLTDIGIPKEGHHEVTGHTYTIFPGNSIINLSTTW